MKSWQEATLVAIASSILLTALFFLIRKHFASKKPTQVAAETPPIATIPPANRGTESLLRSTAGVLTKFDHRPSLHPQIELDLKKKQNYFVFRRGSSPKPSNFRWSDHPALITDAIENGWSRFGFTVSSTTSHSSSIRSSIIGLRSSSASDGGGDHQLKEPHLEITWEVGEESVEFMQKIRLNSGLMSSGVTSVIRTALPLPGPASSFPQEAYFEIKILAKYEKEVGADHQGEKTKLIQEKISSDNVNGNSAHVMNLAHIASSHGCRRLEELKLGSKGGGDKDKGREALISLGLTVGGSLQHKNPGTYRGSIGFNSNGSVLLDGIKLVFESEKEDWVQIDRVIGCGYDPRSKKVFFTADSKLVHMIHCKSEEFEAPLYPVLASNTDITILVNFGQSSFTYGPANIRRTPNPCFIVGGTGGGPNNSILKSSPAASMPGVGYEDSGELFSIGRIDSGWLSYCANKSSSAQSTYCGTNSNSNYYGGRGGFDYDGDESEADLFEIALDNCSATGIRSPMKS